MLVPLTPLYRAVDERDLGLCALAFYVTGLLSPRDTNAFAPSFLEKSSNIWSEKEKNSERELMTNKSTAAFSKRKSVELFAGAGGLGIGLAKAGFEPQLVVEHNRRCCDTLR